MFEFLQPLFELRFFSASADPFLYTFYDGRCSVSVWGIKPVSSVLRVDADLICDKVYNLFRALVPSEEEIIRAVFHSAKSSERLLRESVVSVRVFSLCHCSFVAVEKVNLAFVYDIAFVFHCASFLACHLQRREAVSCGRPHGRFGLKEKDPEGLYCVSDYFAALAGIACRIKGFEVSCSPHQFLGVWVNECFAVCYCIRKA